MSLHYTVWYIEIHLFLHFGAVKILLFYCYYNCIYCITKCYFFISGGKHNIIIQFNMVQDTKLLIYLFICWKENMKCYICACSNKILNTLCAQFYICREQAKH